MTFHPEIMVFTVSGFIYIYIYISKKEREREKERERSEFELNKADLGIKRKICIVCFAKTIFAKTF